MVVLLLYTNSTSYVLTYALLVSLCNNLLLIVHSIVRGGTGSRGRSRAPGARGRRTGSGWPCDNSYYYQYQ